MSGVITLKSGEKLKPICDWQKTELIYPSWGIFWNDKFYSADDFESPAYPDMYEDENGKLQVIFGYEKGLWEHPLALEVTDDCEWGRLLIDVEEDEE